MEESTFQRELLKYKVVRRADHYKVRFSSKKREVKKNERITHTAAAATKKDVAAITAGGNINFWELATGAPRMGLSSAEWTKLIASMKQVYI